MKMKSTIAVLLALLVNVTIIYAQTIQDGINHLYAERYKSAKETFDKLVSTNPNNLEAVYWLGQSYIAMQDTKSARDLYSKTLQANGNAPLIMVGMAEVNLIDGKKDDARQMFETAINLSTGKKGPDANILNAVGKANIDSKNGDIAYALDKLKVAAQRDPKNPDIFLNLGDAYRKVHDGGQAVINYDQAISLNPNMARAIYRKAVIYYTQRNWDIYTDLLKKAVTVDPKFAPAYYDLYYYYLEKLDLNTAQDYAAKFIANADPDPQNDYLRIQTLWAQKKYDDAIAGAKALMAAAGQQTKPRVYKLLADSYVSKGDTADAKQYIDQYFASVKEEDINPKDYILKGEIYSAGTGNDDMVIDSYIKASQMDSDYSDKMDLLQKAVNMFESKKNWCAAAKMRIVQANARTKPVETDPFFIGLRFYQCGDYKRADSGFQAYITLAPDTVFGHYYRAKTMYALDTTMTVEPYASTMVKEYQSTLQLSENNKAKFKNQGIEASKLLAGYYNNIKQNRDSAISYLQKGLDFDSTNASILELIDYLKKASRGRNSKATGLARPHHVRMESFAINDRTRWSPKS